MINLETATIKWAFNLPLGSELTSKALWQGADVSIDPRDQKAYLFQMQAKATGPGDIEDMNFHRYGLTEKDGFLTGATYVDTHIGKGFGHAQTVHTRISAEGNPWHWVGVERYDAKNKSIGVDLCRVLHRRGISQRADAPRVYTGPGSVSALSCPDWQVVLRRRSGSTETIEWHSETALRARTLKDDKVRPVPITSLTVPVGDTIYQTAAASPDLGNFVRLNGATEDASILHAFSAQWAYALDVTSAAPPGVSH